MFPHKFENVNMKAENMDAHPTSGCWPIFKNKTAILKTIIFSKAN